MLDFSLKTLPRQCSQCRSPGFPSHTFVSACLQRELLSAERAHEDAPGHALEPLVEAVGTTHSAARETDVWLKSLLKPALSSQTQRDPTRVKKSLTFASDTKDPDETQPYLTRWDDADARLLRSLKPNRSLHFADCTDPITFLNTCDNRFL